MKKRIFLLFTMILTLTVYPQNNSIEIVVQDEPWATGDVFSNLNSKNVYEGEIQVGNNGIMFWVDMRGWAEFDLPHYLSNKKITKLKLKFYTSVESSANDNTIIGSHNIVIIKFPFDVRINSPLDIINYFYELEYSDQEKIYGVDWEAGESVGIKEIILGKKAIEDLYSSLRNNTVFKIGFWEFNDNAPKCTILGKGSEFPPRLIVEF